ncbi:2-C-methyl-D-erythritol 4-phosphate cytidylyltransferase [Reinekea blandensis]|nr:2-C-methyl-D-erythritol 4-phosphate cytidylyltransferase [Reinekea blandensis]
MSCHLILPAAGVGRRFGSEHPKQYTLVAGKSVMEWTLSAFQSLPFIDQIILVLAEGDSLGQNIAANYPSVTTVNGGDERYGSVLNGLHWLQQRVSADDWVMVHDVARPCVSTADVEKLYHYCQSSGDGAVLATPVTDTTKRRLSDTKVETLDRSTLWAVQTPQCFRLGELHTALQRCLAQSVPVTDEASAIELNEGNVGLVEGSRRNIKLTHADDLAIVELFLTSKETET